MENSPISVSFSLNRAPKEFESLCRDAGYTGSRLETDFAFSVYSVLPFLQEINGLRGEPKNSIWLPHIGLAIVSLMVKDDIDTPTKKIYLSVAINASLAHSLYVLNSLCLSEQCEPFFEGTISPAVSVTDAAFNNAALLPAYLHLGEREARGEWHFREKCITLEGFSAEEKLELLKLIPTRAQVENFMSGEGGL